MNDIIFIGTYIEAYNMYDFNFKEKKILAMQIYRDVSRTVAFSYSRTQLVETLTTSRSLPGS